MRQFKLEALDTLFFRDGRPFNLGETGQMEVEGVFPPYPTTLVGALRYALARGRGWEPRGVRDNWMASEQAAELEAVLGDNERLGSVTFAGPYLLYRDDVLVPAPAYLLGAASGSAAETPWQHLTRLVPSAKTYDTDLGAVRLPEPEMPHDGLKPLNNYWLTSEGLASALAGRVPAYEQIVHKDVLWRSENRTGIRRNDVSHATEEDALYQTQHIRLGPGSALGMGVAGLPGGWSPVDPAPLGGEHRLAWVSETTWQLPACPLQRPSGKLRYTVTLITPGDFFAVDTEPRHGAVNEELEKLSPTSTLVTACVDKPVLVGGWNSRSNEPLPLKPLAPSGSSWFLEAEANDFDMIKARHGTHIGLKTDWGFGQIVIGNWGQEE